MRKLASAFKLPAIAHCGHGISNGLWHHYILNEMNDNCYNMHLRNYKMYKKRATRPFHTNMNSGWLT